MVAAFSLVTLLLLFQPIAEAKGGRGGSRGGHPSSNTKSTASASRPSIGTVHVQGYTKKDGTHVSGYDRRAPGTALNWGLGAPASSKASSNGQDARDGSDPIDIRPSHHSSSSSNHTLSGGFGRTPTHAPGERDAHGRLARSEAAKHAFEKAHPCPSTGKSSGACPGYVIDHITALKRGGADDASNMQWQTVAEAKAKDKWE